jgi:hypothetical protein
LLELGLSLNTCRLNLAESFAILLGDELTTQTEAALAQQAKNPPTNRTTDPTSTSEPHTQDVRGLNKALLVGVTGLEPVTSRV